MCGSGRNPHVPSPRSSTPAIDISRPNTPPTPAVHSSPSFDYHEERRLHLQDEIYFSHRLPRLPPPALEQSVTSGNNWASVQSSSAGRSENGVSADASPSAFHPVAPFTQMRSLTLDEEEAEEHGEGEDEEASQARSPMEMSGGKEVEYDGLPSGSRAGHPTYETPTSRLAAPFSDADAKTQLLDRKEQDEQERLDLEEEKRERLLAEGIAPGSGAQPGASTVNVPQGESSYLSSASLNSTKSLLFSLILRIIIHFIHPISGNVRLCLSSSFHITLPTFDSSRLPQSELHPQLRTPSDVLKGS